MTDNSTLLPRIAALGAIISILSQVVGMFVGVTHGAEPGAVDFGNPDRLAVILSNRQPLILGLVFASLSPLFALPLWLGLFHTIKQAGSLALFGVVISYIAHIFGLLSEVLRFAMFVELPPAYAAGSEAARPALLVIGGIATMAGRLLPLLTFTLGFGVGLFALSLASLRVSALPRWHAWFGVAVAVLFGWVAAPLNSLGVGGPLMGAGLLLFFVWVASTGIILLRWRPAAK